jgi:hypothetical protein
MAVARGETVEETKEGEVEAGVVDIIKTPVEVEVETTLKTIH